MDFTVASPSVEKYLPISPYYVWTKATVRRTPTRVSLEVVTADFITALGGCSAATKCIMDGPTGLWRVCHRLVWHGSKHILLVGEYPVLNWVGRLRPQRRWPVYVLWIYCEGGLVLKAPWKRRFRKHSFAIFRLHAWLSDCQRCITVIVLVATRNLDMLSLILSWMLAVGR